MIRKTGRQNKMPFGFTKLFCVLMKLKKENAASRQGAQNTPAHWERLGKKEFIQFAKSKSHNLMFNILFQLPAIVQQKFAFNL
jgi:hypothetical protein